MDVHITHGFFAHRKRKKSSRVGINRVQQIGVVQLVFELNKLHAKTQGKARFLRFHATLSRMELESNTTLITSNLSIDLLSFDRHTGDNLAIAAIHIDVLRLGRRLRAEIAT